MQQALFLVGLEDATAIGRLDRGTGNARIEIEGSIP